MEDFINDTTEKKATDGSKEQRPYTPTAKQLAYAESIAQYSDDPLTDREKNDGHALSRWIDRNKTTLPPTEKQLAYARSIADKTGLELSENVERSKILLSEWIDKNK